jgi:type I restriction enzyme S subunit
MSFQKYETYKDSGVEWLGEVPEHWDVTRLRFIFEIVKRIAGTDGFDVLSITQKGIKIKDLESGEGQLANDYSKYQVVEKGDFAMNQMDLLTGYVDVSQFDGVTSPDYRVFRLWNINKDYPRYLLRLLQNCYHQRLFFPYGQGAAHLGRWRLPKEEFNNFLFPRPSYEEQTQIARFLDHETARIDALIAEQERLIELLKEKRQAVISHAVTKGLDPTAPMKDSGVEWLGEVPEHWGIGCIKYLSTCISKGTTPTTIGAEFQDNGIRFLKAENIDSGKVTSFPEFYIDENAHEILKRSALAASDVLVVIAGATTGKSAIMPSDILPANTNQAVSFIRLSDSRYAKFVHLWLSTESIQQSIILNSVQSAQPNLSMEDLGNLPIVIPPAKEVRELTTRIYQMIQGCDQLIQEAMIAMDLLQERRSALISAAVTGKIDVRGWQPPASAVPNLGVACG